MVKRIMTKEHSGAKIIDIMGLRLLGCFSLALPVLRPAVVIFGRQMLAERRSKAKTKDIIR